MIIRLFLILIFLLFAPAHAEGDNIFAPAHAEDDNTFAPAHVEGDNIFAPAHAEGDNIFAPAHAEGDNSSNVLHYCESFLNGDGVDLGLESPTEKGDVVAQEIKLTTDALGKCKNYIAALQDLISAHDALSPTDADLVSANTEEATGRINEDIDVLYNRMNDLDVNIMGLREQIDAVLLSDTSLLPEETSAVESSTIEKVATNLYTITGTVQQNGKKYYSINTENDTLFLKLGDTYQGNAFVKKNNLYFIGETEVVEI